MSAFELWSYIPLYVGLEFVDTASDTLSSLSDEMSSSTSYIYRQSGLRGWLRKFTEPNYRHGTLITMSDPSIANDIVFIVNQCLERQEYTKAKVYQRFDPKWGMDGAVEIWVDLGVPAHK